MNGGEPVTFITPVSGVRRESVTARFPWVHAGPWCRGNRETSPSTSASARAFGFHARLRSRKMRFRHILSSCKPHRVLLLGRTYPRSGGRRTNVASARRFFPYSNLIRIFVSFVGMGMPKKAGRVHRAGERVGHP